MTINERKADLRRQIKQMEKQMPRETRAQSDACLARQLLRLDALCQARTVMLFSPFGSEPDLSPVLDACAADGKRLLLPRMTADYGLEAREVRGRESLRAGTFGILEPDDDCPAVPQHEIDFILVPAVCYDVHGGRLGRGAGYYDRFLSGYTGMTVGLCRNCFLQQDVPWAAHDIRVKVVVTEDRVLCCTTGNGQA